MCYEYISQIQFRVSQSSPSSLPDDFAEPQVGRSEVVGPLRDAVRLVDADERDGGKVADEGGEHGTA